MISGVMMFARGMFVLYLPLAWAVKSPLAELLGALGVPSCAEPLAEAAVLHIC